MDVFTLIGAGITVGGAAAFAWLIRTSQVHVLRVSRQPLVRASAVQPGALVHLRGRIVPGASTGEPFTRTWVERLEPRSSAGKGNDADPTASARANWTVLHQHDQRVPFLLDDGSGVLVEVDLDGAKVLCDRRRDTLSRPEQPDPSVLEAARTFLPELPVEGMTLRITTESFVPGDEISVLGLAAARSVTASTDPYRSADAEPPRVRLVRPPNGDMFASHTPLGELALSGRLNAAD